MEMAVAAMEMAVAVMETAVAAMAMVAVVTVAGEREARAELWVAKGTSQQIPSKPQSRLPEQQ